MGPPRGFKNHKTPWKLWNGKWDPPILPSTLRTTALPRSSSEAPLVTRVSLAQAAPRSSGGEVGAHPRVHEAGVPCKGRIHPDVAVSCRVCLCGFFSPFSLESDFSVCPFGGMMTSKLRVQGPHSTPSPGLVWLFPAHNIVPHATCSRASACPLLGRGFLLC